MKTYSNPLGQQDYHSYCLPKGHEAGNHHARIVLVGRGSRVPKSRVGMKRRFTNRNRKRL